MRPLTRALLSSGALAALAAPGLRAEGSAPFASRSELRAGQAPVSPTSTKGKADDLGDSGFGHGMWIPPTDAPGFASAKLYDGAGHLRYVLRANLLVGGQPPPGIDPQGGFLGQLYEVDAKGRRSLAASVSGKWTQHANGWGDFDVEVVVPSADKGAPFVTIGQIQGSLLPAGVIPCLPPGVPEAGGSQASGTGTGAIVTRPDPSAPRELVLMWSIPEE